jgi:RNA polymerase-binding transcription factor DksA
VSEEEHPASEQASALAPAEASDPVLAGARAALAALERELSEVERAVQRLEEGVYGRCEVCDEAIDPGELAKDPTALRCERHSHAGVAEVTTPPSPPQPAE